MLNNLLVDKGNNNYEGPGIKLSNRQALYSIKKRKTRILVQKGLENILLKLEDIVLFYTENKVVYVVDRLEKKYLTDSNLLELEEELDPLVFFRANRQYIININFIKSFRAYEKVKIKLDLNLTELNHCIIVSQETAPHFRKWIYEA
jgi:DNA-binding LytR/AlgR family response regulator